MDDSEQFTPETVDEEIERMFVNRDSATPSQQVLQDLHTQLAARRDELALQRVRTRLVQHGLTQQSALAKLTSLARSVKRARQRKDHQMSESSFATRVVRPLTTLVAVVFLTLLVGSLVFVFQLSRQQHNGTGGHTTTIVAPPDNTLYTFSGTTAYALDGVTHQPLWKHTFPVTITKGKPDIGGILIRVVNGVYYVWYKDNVLYALSTQDGSLLWKYATKQAVGNLVIDSGLVYFVDTLSLPNPQNKITALDALTGALKWQSRTSESYFSVITAAHNILYATDSFEVFAFNAENGAQLWEQTQPKLLNETGGQVVNGVFYLCVLDNNVSPSNADVYAYDAKTGQLRWQKWYDHDTRLITISNGVLYMIALSPSDKTHTPDYIYVEDTIEALSAQNGKLLWKYTAPSKVGVSDPTVSNGTVYITLVNEAKNTGSSVVALNATTGAIRWSYPLATKPTYTAPTLVDNTLAVAVTAGKIVLLNRSDGKLISTITIDPAQQGIPDVTVNQWIQS